MIIKNVPFYSNTADDTHCYQATLRIILKFFTPTKNYSWKELEELTAKKEGLWTWTTLGIINMQKLGFKVVDLGTFNYKQFAKKGEDYLYKKYGEEVAKEQIKYSDIPQEIKIAKEYLKIFDNKLNLPTFKILKEYISNNYLVICLVNSQALNNKKGYVGHFVVVFGYDDKYLYIHDPGLPPQKNRKVLFEQFRKAWEYPDKNARNLIGFRLFDKKKI